MYYHFFFFEKKKEEGQEIEKKKKDKGWAMPCLSSSEERKSVKKTR